MRERAVFFDLECTLTDRAQSIQRFSGRFINDFSADLRGTEAQAVAELIFGCDECGYALRSSVCDALATKLNWTKSPGSARLLHYWQSTFPECTSAREGTRETLVALRDAGFKLAIVSNGNTRAQKRKIAVLGIENLLDGVFISDELKCRKPDRRIFELALRAIAVDPKSTWFVGDHPLNDIEGARLCGLNAIWLRGVHRWPDELAFPKASIDRLSELPAIWRILPGL
jgi:putative hydrolase of the HAD superfamily